MGLVSSLRLASVLGLRLGVGVESRVLGPRSKMRSQGRGLHHESRLSTESRVKSRGRVSDWLSVSGPGSHVRS